MPRFKTNIKLKKSFKNVNYYSLPKSILFVVKKRFNIVILSLALILILVWSL